jgi:hypothetical protein
MAELTDKEKIALLKRAFPGISDKTLKDAVPQIKDKATIDYLKENNGALPESVLSRIFTGTDYIAGPMAEFQVMEAGMGGAAIAKALTGFAKSFFAKKTATKAAEEAAKAGKKKIITKKRVAGVAGLSAAVGTYNMIESGKGTEIDPNASAAELQAQDSFAQAIANADAQGVDVTQFLQGTTAQQLGIGANNISDFMSARGYVNPLTGLNGIGIFTGKETPTSTPRRKFGGTITGSKSEIVSLSEWNKSFPVDAAGIGAAKQKFVSAGVLDPTADLTQVKAAWDKYGQLSLDYSRAGNKVSPWQLLDIQKGLTGSGSQTTTTIDDSPMAKADITTILKRQLGASLGLANIDDETINKFIKDVRKKEAKSPTKSVRTTTGNTTRVKTVQGYGQSDVLADAEAYAKQDPRYAEYQTADVFGNALVKALGLKS